jgi:quercetin dioxygenase-like cupin family protein
MPIYPNFGNDPEGGISYTAASASWQHGRNLSVGLLRMEGGAFSTPHYHNDEQFIYMLKGRIRIASGGEISNASPGDLVHFPPGALHEVATLGEEAAEFLLSRGPARENPNDDVFTPEGEAAKSLLPKE